MISNMTISTPSSNRPTTSISSSSKPTKPSETLTTVIDKDEESDLSEEHEVKESEDANVSDENSDSVDKPSVDDEINNET